MNNNYVPSNREMTIAAIDEYTVDSPQRKFDAMKLSTVASLVYERNVDWHIMSSQLDAMRSEGIVTLIGHTNSGLCEYRLSEAYLEGQL